MNSWLTVDRGQVRAVELSDCRQMYSKLRSHHQSSRLASIIHHSVIDKISLHYLLHFNGTYEGNRLIKERQNIIWVHATLPKFCQQTEGKLNFLGFAKKVQS